MPVKEGCVRILTEFLEPQVAQTMNIAAYSRLVQQLLIELIYIYIDILDCFCLGEIMGDLDFKVSGPVQTTSAAAGGAKGIKLSDKSGSKAC